MHIGVCFQRSKPLWQSTRASADFLTSVQLFELVPDGEQGSAADSPGVSVSSLQELLNQGLAIQLQLNSLERLQAILQGHQAWEARMQHLLQGELVPYVAPVLLRDVFPLGAAIIAAGRLASSAWVPEKLAATGLLEAPGTMQSVEPSIYVELGSWFCMTGLTSWAGLGRSFLAEQVHSKSSSPLLATATCLLLLVSEKSTFCSWEQTHSQPAARAAVSSAS